MKPAKMSGDLGKKIFGIKKRSVVLAAMPKSGSTFLSRSLQQITGFPDHYLAQNYKNIEQELNIDCLIDGSDRDTVTQQHFKANEPNIDLLRLFGIRPTIVYRSIPDVLISMRDHLNNEVLDNIPNLYPPSGYRVLSEKEQLDFLIQHAAPWLVAFFSSWEKERQKRRGETLCLYYEDCRKDWATSLKKILDFYEIEFDGAAVDETLANMVRSPRAKLRINVGIQGRGSEELDDIQIGKLRQLAAPYSDLDFSRVGI